MTTREYILSRLSTALWATVLTFCMSLTAHAGLVAYYPFDSDYNDAAGANHLTEYEAGGTVGITTNAGEHVFGGGAADFDSTTSDEAYLNLTQPMSLAANQPWSIAFWVRRRAGTDNRTCMVAGDPASTVDFLWASDNPSQVQGLRFRSSANQNANFGGFPDDGQYHHWVVVANGAGSVMAYRDNVPQTAASISSAFNVTAIGDGYSGTTHSMNGQLDDVAIFDVALTAPQVNALYLGDFSEWLQTSSGGPVLAPSSVASNAVPGTLVGSLSYGGTNNQSGIGYLLVETNDFASFFITETTNLRTTSWIAKSSYDIAVAASKAGTALSTNDITVTVTPTPSDYAAFEVRGEVEPGVADGSEIVGVLTVRGTDAAAYTFAMAGGRTDLFEIDSSGTGILQLAGSDPGPLGTRHHIYVQATNGVGASELIIVIDVVQKAASGTIFVVK